MSNKEPFKLRFYRWLAGYQEKVYRDRKKYGMPDMITSSPLFKVNSDGDVT